MMKYEIMPLIVNKLIIHTRGGGGGVLDIFLGGEVRPGPSYPDPV